MSSLLPSMWIISSLMNQSLLLRLNIRSIRPWFQVFLLEAINAYAKELVCETDTNFVTLVMMRDAEGAVYPTKQQFADVVKQVRGEKLEAYVDNVKQEPLMAELPKAGKIKKTTENKLFGYKMLTLSNGAKVVLKKTDFKNDEVQFAATADGGTSVFGTKDLNEVKMMGALMNSSGLRGFTNNDLEKRIGW